MCHMRHRQPLRVACISALALLVAKDGLAQSGPRLAWEEDPNAQVTGYAVTIDGVRSDYGLAPLNSSGVCGCSIAVPFSGGQHTVVVSAYDLFTESAAAPVLIAPVANAGAGYSGTVGAPLPVNGGGSVAPTGTIVSYRWDWGDGTSDTVGSTTAAHTYSSSGTFTLRLTVTDNAGATAMATTAAAIAPAAGANSAPVAADDVATVRRGRSVTVPILTNDIDANGDSLVVTSITQPTIGSARISNGTVIYTAAQRYTGVVGFGYAISDGHGGAATATIRVTVTK